MRIGIIGAMSVETDAIKNKLDNMHVETVSGTDFYTGTLYGKETVVAKCGIGKVFAAICAQTMILRFGVTHIINTGIGGTLTDRLDLLDVAVADGVVQHDMDTSAIGDPIGLISGINKTVIPTSHVLAELAMRAANELDIHCIKGVIASGDQFIGDVNKKSFIADTFGAICCEMEGAAIGHVCYVNGVECLVVRSVSDSASGKATMEYPVLAARAAEQSQRLTEKIFSLI